MEGCDRSVTAHIATDWPVNGVGYNLGKPSIWGLNDGYHRESQTNKSAPEWTRVHPQRPEHFPSLMVAQEETWLLPFSCCIRKRWTRSVGVTPPPPPRKGWNSLNKEKEKAIFKDRCSQTTEGRHRHLRREFKHTVWTGFKWEQANQQHEFQNCSITKPGSKLKEAHSACLFVCANDYYHALFQVRWKEFNFHETKDEVKKKEKKNGRIKTALWLLEEAVAWINHASGLTSSFDFLCMTWLICVVLENFI